MKQKQFGLRLPDIIILALHNLNELSESQNESVQDFLQQPTFSAYSSQSGEIFGILENMLDTFTADLKESRELWKGRE